MTWKRRNVFKMIERKLFVLKIMQKSIGGEGVYFTVSGKYPVR